MSRLQHKIKLMLLNTVYFVTNRDAHNQYQHTLPNECQPRHHARTYTQNTHTNTDMYPVAATHAAFAAGG